MKMRISSVAALFVGGAIGFLLGSTVEFIKNFDKEYDFEIGDE